jgi:hypothetical protein
LDRVGEATSPVKDTNAPVASAACRSESLALIENNSVLRRVQAMLRACAIVQTGDGDKGESELAGDARSVATALVAWRRNARASTPSSRASPAPTHEQLQTLLGGDSDGACVSAWLHDYLTRPRAHTELWSVHFAPRQGAEVASSASSVRALALWLRAHRNADIELPHVMLDAQLRTPRTTVIACDVCVCVCARVLAEMHRAQPCSWWARRARARRRPCSRAHSSECCVL